MEGAEFCTNCGERLHPPAATVTATAPGEPAAEAFGEQKPADERQPTAELRSERVPAGTVIDNKYKIARVLGEGGMGVVYLAEDVHTGANVVLKAVRPELAHRKDVRERTLGEGRVLARIDHPNVVHLNAVVEDATGLWLVMQYIDGESLDVTIKRHTKDGKQVPFATAIDVFRQILMGVGAAHQEGVIHRDLKPANVLVRKKDGVTKVTDFGIAKPEEQARIGQGKTKGIIGSLWYMSPEQVQGRKDVDKRVDIYSLGILFFELLTGRVPFNADSSYELMRKHVEEALPKVVLERSDVPPWVDEVLARACAKSRDDRYPSAEDFLAAIDAHMPARPTQLAGYTRVPSATKLPDVAASAQAAQPTGAGTSITKAGEPSGGRGWIYMVVGLVAVGLGAAGVFVFLQDEPAPKKKKPATTTETAGPTATLPDAPSATASAEPDPLDVLTGKWQSEAGTDFDAVRVGDSIEFRVVDAKQLEPSDYRDGEARFILRANADGTFKVEDKIRPQPPLGSAFDPKSRNTCQEIWTEVSGKPLTANYDGSRLAVNFAKIAPKPANFINDGSVIMGCTGLRNVGASIVRSVLSREQ